MVTARSRAQLMAARVINYVYYGMGLGTSHSPIFERHS